MARNGGDRSQTAQAFGGVRTSPISPRPEWSELGPRPSRPIFRISRGGRSFEGAAFGFVGVRFWFLGRPNCSPISRVAPRGL